MRIYLPCNLHVLTVIIAWSASGTTGSVIRVLRGHTDYVYEVALGNNEELLSCGEDHTVVGTF